MKTKPKKYVFEMADMDGKELSPQTYYLHAHCDFMYVYMFLVEGYFDASLRTNEVMNTIEDNYRYGIQYGVCDGEASPELLIRGIDSESQAHII